MSSPPPDDELARAIDRLQAFAREVPIEEDATRRRVLSSQRATRRSPRTIALMTTGLIALFGGPALAHFSGVMDLVPEWLSPDSRDARGVEPSRASRPHRARAENAAIPTPPVESSPPPPAPPTVKAPAALRSDGTISTRRPKPPKAAASEPAADRRELYRLAHAAHFSSGDPEQALRAWDAFLTAAPSDTFAPEARYNRAILLVKLERHAQALEALAPFACAPSGAYRQREARALIDRVRARAPELDRPACGDSP